MLSISRILFIQNGRNKLIYLEGKKTANHFIVQVFFLPFRELNLQIGQRGSTLLEFRKNCPINFKMVKTEKHRSNNNITHQVSSFLEQGSHKKAETITTLLQNTITSLGVTVYDLSTQHKVVGIFIKWFGCPMCAEAIEVVGKMFASFIKLNTLPIIFHQEKDETACKAMDNATDLNVKYIPFCKVTKELQNLLGIGSASMGNHMEAMVKSNVLGLMSKKYKIINF